MDAEMKKRLGQYGWDLPCMKEDIKDLDDRAASQGAPLAQESDPAESDPVAAASQNQIYREKP